MGILRLFVIAVGLACLIGYSNGGYGRRNPRNNVNDDDNNWRACNRKCENTNCKALNNMKSRNGKAQKCVDFLHDSCEDERNVEECLSSFQGNRYKSRGCSVKVLKNAKQCLKCEAGCYKSFRSTSHFNQHDGDHRRGHRNDDDEYDDDKNRGFHRHHGDDDDHDHGDDSVDYGDQKEECFEKCANTRECRAVDRMSDKAQRNCRDFAKKFCENMDYKSCIIKMKDKENRKCPKSTRAKTLTCHTCNESCKNHDHVTGNKSEPEHYENCINQCRKTPHCMYASNASKEVEYACDEFVATKCGNTTDVSACVKDLNEVEDVKCPASHRMNVTACMDCQENCAQPQEKQMNQCLMNCSQTETCMAVNAEDASTLKNCDDWISKSCGNFTNVQECLEMNLMEDDRCAEPLRRQIGRCRKCEKQCATDHSDD